jgi:L,D-peptidoglycan transpeptidase YkuD (ErfK/YbiS/YcfS/YnhG family)
VLVALILALIVALAAQPTVGLAGAAAAGVRPSRLTIPANADQLIVVSAPTAYPAAPGYLATLRAFHRADRRSPWRMAFGPWPAETGSGHLVPGTSRREGDHATPIGVFGIGATMYGNRSAPLGLRYRYRHLVCGDWWDEDPYSPRYNQFVHVPCNSTPSFAAGSEALWTERIAYPYFAVLGFNTGPIVGGRNAPGSAIFLHSWVGGPTNGCIALHPAQLLRLLRWLEPTAHPAIEIGTGGLLGAR